MKRSLGVLAFIVFGGATLAAGWLWGHGASDHRNRVAANTSPALDSRVEQAESQSVQLLRTALQEQARAQAQAISKEGQSPGAVPSNAPTLDDSASDADESQVVIEERDDNGETKKSKQQRQQYRQLLDEQFERQPAGSQWARDTSRTIHNALISTELPASARLQSVDCRENLCRVQVTTDDVGYDTVFNKLLDARWSFGLGPGAFFLSRDDKAGNTRGLVMFLASPGTELPSRPTS